MNSSFFQRGKIAIQALGGRRVPGSAGNKTDAHMPMSDQMGSEFLCGHLVFQPYLVESLRQQVVDKHGRDFAVAQVGQGLKTAIVCRRQNHAINTPLMKCLDNFQLLLRIVMRIREQHHQPVFHAFVFNRSHHFAEVVIRERGNCHANRIGSRHRQRAGQRILRIADPLDGHSHLLFGFRSDFSRAIQYVRNRRDRDICRFCNVAHRRHVFPAFMKTNRYLTCPGQRYTRPSILRYQLIAVHPIFLCYPVGTVAAKVV